MSKTTHEDVDNLIAASLKRRDLTPEDVLRLTVARRLNNASDHTFAAALGGMKDDPPLNFWGKR